LPGITAAQVDKSILKDMAMIMRIMILILIMGIMMTLVNLSPSAQLIIYFKQNKV
jgi:hypothetical protein